VSLVIRTRVMAVNVLDSVHCSSSIVSDAENDPDWYTTCSCDDESNCNLRLVFLDFGLGGPGMTLSLF